MPPRTLERADDTDSASLDEDEEQPTQGRPRRRAWKVGLWVAAILIALIVLAVIWFLVGRETAEPLTQRDALEGFRATADETADAQGRPLAGVYSASASGSESIGVPGLDEGLGPQVPVTVTYSGAGCFTYRADFNSHHWRSWDFCPTDAATFALVELQSWTARKAPALDVESLSTYTCDEPLALLWDGMEPGDGRSGKCTGTMDTDESVTDDRGTVEVTGTEAVTVGDTEIEAIRLRTVDELTNAQTGREQGDWWLDPTTGLPLRIVIESDLAGGATTYSEHFDLRLDTLSPDT